MIPAGLLPDWVGTWCVAGGWAACPALALDKDVWVFADAKKIDSLRRQYVSYLTSEFQEAFEEQDDSRQQFDQYKHLTVSIRRVGKVLTFGAPTHVLLTDAENIYELINGFDVSTHAIALRSTGHVFKATGWTPTSVPPVILHDTTTTPERMRKIAKRYGHPAPFSILEP